MEIPSSPAQIEAMKRLILTAGILLVTGAAVDARDPNPADVIVFVKGTTVPPGPVDYGARSVVSRIYASIGVKLSWRDGEAAAGSLPGNPARIQVCYARGDQAKASSEALALAAPFSDAGTQITVIYDRILTRAARPGLAQALLAHVLAHEIGHLLQGTNWHARTGVMKAHWNGQDYGEMERKPLAFTSDDLDLIRLGLDRLKGRIPSSNSSAASR